MCIGSAEEKGVAKVRLNHGGLIALSRLRRCMVLVEEKGVAEVSVVCYDCLALLGSMNPRRSETWL